MRRLLALLMALWAATAQAVPTANSLITVQTPKHPMLGFTLTANCTASTAPVGCCTGSGAGCVIGTYYDFVTAGSNGTKCTAIYATSTDGTNAHLMTLRVLRGSSSYTLTAVSVPLSSGSAAAVPAVNFITAGVTPGLGIDSDGNSFFFLESGDKIQATHATAITTGTQVNLHADCGDF